MDKLGPYLLGPNDENQGIYTGDARVLAESIPDESVDLIFTDPVYQNFDDYAWLAETGKRILKPSGDCIVYLANYHLDKVIAAMTPFLDYRWLLSQKKMSSGTLIWSYRLFSHVIPALWFSKGPPRKGPRRVDFFHGSPDGRAVNHGWSKNTKENVRWLNRFGLPEDVIFDPFSGGCSIIAACKMLGRRWLAFEIEPPTAELGRKQVCETQPPLFVVPQPQQLDLALT